MTHLTEQQVWFDMIYRKYRVKMYSVALRILGNDPQQRIDDIIHDVFRRAIEKYDKIKDHPEIEYWLINAVKYQILTELKKAHYKWETESLEIFDRPPNDIPDSRKRSNQEPYTEDHYFDDFLSSLPEGLTFEEIRILFLHDVAGYTHREIAQMLDCTELSSRSRLFRAKARFKTLKEKEEKNQKTLQHSNSDQQLLNRRCKDD